MGKRGPKPSANGLPKMPDALAGDPQPPPDLDGLALETWRRVLDWLRPLGTLARCDQDAVELYCRTYAGWRQAEAALAASGPVLTGPDGAIRSNPAAAVARDCRSLLIRLQTELGLNPGGRVRNATRRGHDALAAERWEGLLPT
jgi:P27 family predicted phage terminase small subunit